MKTVTAVGHTLPQFSVTRNYVVGVLRQAPKADRLPFTFVGALKQSTGEMVFLFRNSGEGMSESIAVRLLAEAGGWLLTGIGVNSTIARVDGLLAAIQRQMARTIEQNPEEGQGVSRSLTWQKH